MRVGILCGVPKADCIGGTKSLSHNLEGKVKIHSSSEEAFKCHAKYLLKQGYTQIGVREFKSPVDGYIRVLTKKSHFGSVLRSGKSEDTARGKRGMPKGKFTGGTIISC